MPHFLLENVDITPFSAYKTKATARYFFAVKNVEDVSKLSEIYHFAKVGNLPILTIGSGTNCLFAFDVFPGIVIRNEFKGFTFSETDDTQILEANSGELVHTIAQSAFQNLENRTLIPWSGLPGTIGGAVIGNAGCFGLEIKDILLDAKILFLETGEIHTIHGDDFEFEYRTSKYKGKEDIFLISARFTLSKAFPDNLFMRDYTPESLRELRSSKQPAGISCGSFFRNPTEKAAGALIDTVWLKGKIVGSAKISEKHANFFMGTPPVHYEDILELRNLAKEAVKNQFGIELQEEVRIITL